MPLLEQALKLSPKLAKAHYFMGIALKADGRYDEALSHLEAAAAEYPRDRVVLGIRQIPGACNFCSGAMTRRSGRCRESSLSIPEDLDGPLQPDAVLSR